MQISTFQALCLLPDGEQFTCFVKYRKKRGGTIKLKRQRTPLTLEQVVALFESSPVARLLRKPGIGYLVTVSGKYVKADAGKSMGLAADCGIRFTRRSKPKPTSPAPLLGDANDANFLPHLNERVSIGRNR